jgi:regulatory protein YycH of two-component signal transduction system YycFG
MIERVKTFLLLILIMLSLILSGFLWYSTPRLENLNSSDYVAPQLRGHTYELADVVRPAAVFLHSGDSRHWEIKADTEASKKIMPAVNKWYFYDVTEQAWDKEDWNQLVNKRKGIEVAYNDAVPWDIFSEMFTVRGRTSVGFSSVDRIWVYVNKEENTCYALLLSGKEHRVLHARVSVSPMEVDSFYLAPAMITHLPEQIVVRSSLPLYLPKNRGDMIRYRYFYQLFTVQQAIETVFVDPNLTRQVTERDGTIIYTDGSKAVSIPPHRQYMSYNNPVHEWESVDSERADYESVNAAISFVNLHGGWNGAYSLESLESVRPGRPEPATYRFRQYIGPYPLFGEKDGQHIVSVRMAGGAVSAFQCPLLQLDTYFERTPVKVMSGADLIGWLKRQNINLAGIKAIRMGLHSRIIYDFVEMVPVWEIQLADRPVMYINAEVKETRKTAGTGGLTVGLE